ncbi:helix-turn-helix domain-containing protein [Actinomadura sp. NPDC049382]|uniref:helix-turn-helix domain-containing protein n=1 Tax=Actinomadura sp. NPDC049382 TaxID=3158220 RepID=UPI0034146767
MTTDLYTAAEAADEVGVSVNTVYSWVRRKHLVHAGKRGRAKLFRLSDVFECEKTRQQRNPKNRNP